MLTATVTSDTPDPFALNNDFPVDSLVIPPAGTVTPAAPAELGVYLQLVKGNIHSDLLTFTVGAPLQYVITVTNNGPTSLTYDARTKTGALVLTDVLPAGMDVISGRENTVEFFPSKTNRTVSLNLLGGPGSGRPGALLPNQSIQVVVEVRARFDAFTAAVAAGSWSVTDAVIVEYQPPSGETATGPGSRFASVSNDLEGSGLGKGPDVFVDTLFSVLLGRGASHEELYFWSASLVYLDLTEPKNTVPLTSVTPSLNEQAVLRMVLNANAAEHSRHVASDKQALTNPAGILKLAHDSCTFADFVDLASSSRIRAGYAHP